MQKQLSNLLSMALLTAGVSVAAQAQTIKTVIDFPNTALGITANPVTNRVYAIAPTISDPTDSLAVIDGNADVLLESLPVPIGASAVTVDYFANRIYVAGCDYTQSPSPCTVTVINGKTNATIKTVAITSTPGLGLTGITVNPLTEQVYVANADDNVINIINGCKDADKLVGSINLSGNSPAAIAINPILNRLYVPYGSNLTAVIDAGKKKVLSTSNFGSVTVGAAVNLLNGHVFVTDDEVGPSLTGAFDKNGKQLASITVDDTPLGVDVDPVTDLVFVAATALDTVDVIDGKTNTLKTTVSNVPADYIAVNLATEKVYVAGRLGVTVLTEK